MAFVIGVIYCVYILIDTQLILGGKNKELTLDNYVMGAMILYVDIIGLFLKILQLLGEKKKDWLSINQNHYHRNTIYELNISWMTKFYNNLC